MEGASLSSPPRGAATASMADCANKFLKNFIPEKDIKAVSSTSPVPSNIQGPKQFDDCFKELLEEKRKKKEPLWDSNLERIGPKQQFVQRSRPHFIDADS